MMSKVNMWKAEYGRQNGKTGGTERFEFLLC